MIFRLVEKTEELSSAFSVNSESIDIAAAGGDSFSCVAVIDVDTPAAKVFASTAVDVDADTIEIVGHGLSTGLVGQLTTTDALPTGLSTTTDYYVIVVDEDNIQLAASLADAKAGAAIDITGQGAGDDTFTPTALAGASIKLQQSNDNVTFVDLGSATNITADANILLEKDRPTCRYVRVALALASGHISAALQMLVKGDRA